MSYIKLTGLAKDVIRRIEHTDFKISSLDIEVRDALEEILLIGCHAILYENIKSYILQNNGDKREILDYLNTIDDKYFKNTTESFNETYRNSKQTFIKFYHSRNNLVHLDKRAEDSENQHTTKLDLIDLKRYIPYLKQFINDLDNFYNQLKASPSV